MENTLAPFNASRLLLIEVSRYASATVTEFKFR
jgi:hypothetical protein